VILNIIWLQQKSERERERLSLSKLVAQKFDVERLNHKKLNDVGFK